MESLILNGCFLSDIDESFNIETISSEHSDYLLNDNLGTASSSDEYNILNLDGFIPDISNIDSIIGENVAVSEAATRPKVYLLDENVKKFEDLLENDIVDKIAGNMHISSWTRHSPTMKTINANLQSYRQFDYRQPPRKCH